MGGHWAAYKTNSNNLWMLFDDTGVDVDDLCRTVRQISFDWLRPPL